MADVQKRILDIIQEPNLAAFATVTEDGNPWVRYVIIAAAQDLTIRFATFADARKVAQIKKNSEVHLACGVTDPASVQGYLQVQGRAAFTTETAEREACWHETLTQIFDGPDDPRYGVINIKPYRIELWSAGSFEPEVWEKTE